MSRTAILRRWSSAEDSGPTIPSATHGSLAIESPRSASSSQTAVIASAAFECLASGGLPNHGMIWEMRAAAASSRVGVGVAVGVAVAVAVGVAVGTLVAVGMGDGVAVGEGVAVGVGVAVGEGVGVAVGVAVGVCVAVGTGEGVAVGGGVGLAEGCTAARRAGSVGVGWSAGPPQETSSTATTPADRYANRNEPILRREYINS